MCLQHIITLDGRVLMPWMMPGNRINTFADMWGWADGALTGFTSGKHKVYHGRLVSNGFPTHASVFPPGLVSKAEIQYAIATDSAGGRGEGSCKPGPDATRTLGSICRCAGPAGSVAAAHLAATQRGGGAGHAGD